MAGVAAATESPLHGRWLALTILVVLTALGMLGLGFWQLGRLEGRRALNAHIAARLKEPPLQFDGRPIDPETAELRRVVARGTFDYEHEIYLRNQAYNEYPGVHVITPLRLTGQAAAVLVDRGWIPLRDGAPVAPDAYARPAGEVEVTGVISRSRTRLNSLSPADLDPQPGGARIQQWFRVDVPKIQRQTPYPLLSLYIQKGDVDPETGALLQGSFEFPRADPQLDLSEGDHLGYAIQWFTFAAIAVGGYILLYRGRANRE